VAVCCPILCDIVLAPRRTVVSTLLVEGLVMDITRLGQIVLILLSPTLIIGAALHLPRWVRAASRTVRNRTRPADHELLPLGPPIEELAGDLRRLLLQHDAVRRTTEAAMRAQRMRAIEAAITDCAVQAARALDVPCPDRAGPVALEKPQLRRLLRALRDAGLVLPKGVALLAVDRRR
jgi:hypothetical protein